MSISVLRLLTVVAGVATVIAGFIVAAKTGDHTAKDILIPIGAGLAGWGTPHPADASVAPKEDK